MTPLPLLIAPKQRRPLPPKVAAMFAGDYTLGWLCKSETGYGWVTWGLLPKERALQAAQEVLEKSGPREILVWDQPLTANLTIDQVAVIRATQTKSEEVSPVSMKKQTAPSATEVKLKTDPAVATTQASADPPVGTQPDPADAPDANPAAQSNPLAPPDPPAADPATLLQPDPSVAAAPPTPVPTVGRIVRYHLPITGETRPAMIVSVHSDESVDLQVFTNGEADKRAIFERVVMLNVNNGAEHHQVPSLVNRQLVTMGTEPGQWSWPARA